MRCGSSSDGSGSNLNVTVKVGLLYIRVGAGAAEARPASKFSPEPDNNNYAAPQHKKLGLLEDFTVVEFTVGWQP
jgi:hypothetical protein